MTLMTEQEMQDTELWFSEAINSLTVLELHVQDKLDDPATSDDNDWLRVLGVVRGTTSMVMAAEEKFRSQQTLLLKPPDQDVIDETVAKSRKLADLIVSEKRARAVLKFADDLFTYFSELLS